MSLKGGYQIINLKNLEFNSEMGNSERYPDIYFNMVNSHAKMIIVSGLNMDGVKYNDYETIFYEKDDGDGMYFQAIARRIWNTRDYKCITKYINIFSDDRVTCSQDEFVYEILPDGELSFTSTNAVQNKVITDRIVIKDGSIKISESFTAIANGAPSDEINVRSSRCCGNKNGTFSASIVFDGRGDSGVIRFDITVDCGIQPYIENGGSAIVVGCDYVDANGNRIPSSAIPCRISESIDGKYAIIPIGGLTGEASTYFLADSGAMNYVTVIGMYPNNID